MKTLRLAIHKIYHHCHIYLANEVVWLADKDGLVRLVVAESEALICVTPGQVPIRVAGNEDLVLLDRVHHSVAVLDLTNGTFQLLKRG